jgi:NAD+ synthase (glutamine-hydrolysing)
LNQNPFPIIDLVGYKVCIAEQNALRTNPKPTFERFSYEEEIAYGATIWLWDYLRRSTAKGFFLPLSGGVDSASSLALVGVMCQKVFRAYHEFDEGYNKQVIHDALVQIMGKIPESDRELIQNIMFTAYMGTTNSSEETRSRARRIAEEIGCTHFENTIDELFDACKTTFAGICGTEIPKFEVEGGTMAEDLAL